MNIILLGAAGFIGKNLTVELLKNKENILTLVDKSVEFFGDIDKYFLENVKIIEERFEENTDFDRLLLGQDIVYHLVSTTVPTTSNQNIAQELKENVIATTNMLEACIRCKIKKIIFFSSGGTVYGKNTLCPISEDSLLYPINSYGLQKVTIEKILYLYWHIYGLDYRIVRLSNPYGPYQRPNGILGAVTTFTYRALKNEKIIVYGDGSVIRDYIYIEDAVRAVLNVANGNDGQNIFNIGSGYGTSIQKVLETIQSVLKKKLNVIYRSERKVDVPENYLNVARYEEYYGKMSPVTLHEGIEKTVFFLKQKYEI